MEAICSSETSVDFQRTILRYILEDSTVYQSYRIASLRYDLTGQAKLWIQKRREFYLNAVSKQIWINDPVFTFSVQVYRNVVGY
jgi:hypothetical protein